MGGGQQESRLGPTLLGAVTGDLVDSALSGNITPGGVVATFVETFARGVMDRFGTAQCRRVEQATRIILEDSAGRRASGAAPRPDWIFVGPDIDPTSTDAADLLEGVLLHAANSYQAAKVPILAHLYAAIAHDASVSVDDAHYFVRLADQLTYRQLVGLAVIERRAEHEHALTLAHSHVEAGLSLADPAITLELDDLASRGLIGIGQRDGSVAAPTSVWGADHSVSASGAMLTAIGERFVYLLTLEKIPEQERIAWITSAERPLPKTEQDGADRTVPA